MSAPAPLAMKANPKRGSYERCLQTKRIRNSTARDSEKARDFLEANQIKFVLAQFVDIHGVAKTKAVPVEHFEDVILEDGAGFAGFALWGMGQEPHDPDYMAIGDLATSDAGAMATRLREDRVRRQGQG